MSDNFRFKERFNHTNLLMLTVLFEFFLIYENTSENGESE